MPIQWTYEYSPFTSQNGREIPAFEIFDHHGRTILMTNEHQPIILQENAARLAAKAPELAAHAERIIRCWKNSILHLTEEDIQLWDDANLAAAINEIATLLDLSKEASNDA